MERILTLTALAEVLACSEPTARRIARSVHFPAARRLLGRRRFWLESEVDRWLQGLPPTGDSTGAELTEGA